MDPELTQTLEAMQRTLAALDARVAALEASLGAASAPGVSPLLEPTVAPTPEPPQPPVTVSPVHDEAIAPDILLAMSAAVAAFLGERAHVRQVRLISSQAWGQQGRVNVQASHTLYR